MNCDVSKSHALPSTHVSDYRLYKKSRRKRRKNKFFLSKFKKSNKKKFQTQNMSQQNIPTKSKRYHNKEETECSGNSKVMSNWYWSNYKKAVEWQDKHRIAHWKACALALQEENRYLMQIIHSMQSGMYLNVPVTMKNLEKKVHTCKKMTKPKSSERKLQRESVKEVVANDDEEIEFEMSEEMIKFFEQSFKHKMDLERAKQEKEELNAENEVKQIQVNKLKRTEEMKLLYGDSASMIIGMETAVQLSFDRYCDTKSPKYWPNIPLRL